MTESQPIAANPFDETRQLHGVGASAGPEIRICDDDGQPLDAGDEGELCVRGECVTAGYEYRLHMGADLNLSAFHVSADGHWLRTGDKGRVQPSNDYVVLSGRFKEIISRGGEKISPLEIEQALTLTQP